MADYSTEQNFRLAQKMLEQQAEINQLRQRVTRAKALHSRDDSGPHGPWCGTCTAVWPCRTWIALLDQPADGEQTPTPETAEETDRD